MIEEISLVSARMFNVIDNKLKSIKHILNKFLNGMDVILISDFYQAPLGKITGSFQISNIMLMH
jgi:hypothetical protein